MTPGPASRRRDNAFVLLKRLVSGGVNLAKLEIRRGREEVARNLAEIRGGVLRLAIAFGIAVVFLIGFIAFLIAVLVVVGLWWVALILLVLLLLIAFLLVRQGVSRLKNPTPEETIAAVKEDIEWAKTRLLRRG